MPDWPAFVREFGLPLAMLFTFVTAIVTGTLVAGKSVEVERAAAKERMESERAMLGERITDWKTRAADEHQRAIDAESRLDAALPALALATEQLRTAREDIARSVPRG